MKRLLQLCLKLCLVLGLGIIVSAGCGQAEAKSEVEAPLAALPSLSGKKILMVYGGWPGHKPKEFVDKISLWLQEAGAEVIISDSLEVYADANLMSSIDVIVPSWTMGEIGKEASAGLLSAIKTGTGIAGFHGGFGDSFRSNTEYQYMVGGQWVAHPGGQLKYEVNFADAADPVIAGLEDFSITTEQYYMHVDPNVKVLASTKFSGEHDNWIGGGTMPVVWKKYFGEGRVFYCSLGHAPDVFDVAEAKQLLMRGIRWASGSKYLPKEAWISPIYAK